MTAQPTTTGSQLSEPAASGFDAQIGPDQPFAGSRATLIAVSLGTLVALMTFTAPTTTLAATAAGLHAGSVAQIWMFTGTPVGLAALLLTAGSLADARGRRRVFGAGAVLLAMSSVLAAAAPDTAAFLAGRVLQGVASAALLTAGLGLIAAAYPAGLHRIRATGIWGAMVGAGIALGPVYAAVLSDAAGWRAIYWGLAILSGVVLALVVGGVPESRAPHPRALDIYGAVVLGIGIACLVAGFGEGRDGWARWPVVVLVLAGLTMTALFWRIEKYVAEPMLDPTLLRNSAFLAACTGAFVTGLAVVSLMSFVPTLLQVTIGMTPLDTGLILAVWSGLSVVSALQTRRLAGRLPAAGLVAAGLLLTGLGEVALYGLRAGGGFAHLVPGLAVAGIGTGVVNAALAQLSVSSVPAGRAAMGSGANNTARYVGSALGVAVVVSVSTAADPGSSTAQAFAAGGNHAALLTAALCVVGAAVVLLLHRRDGSTVTP
ncbi:MAG TPA: MFS transporter [Mycobacteriales bacterium]